MRAFSLGSVAVIFAASACVDFDREDQITDLRVLAVQATPPELLYSPLVVFGPADAPGAAFDVGLDVVAADPRGGTLKFSLRLCREDAADETCDDVSDDDVDALVASLPEGDRDAARKALAPPPQSIAVDLDGSRGSTVGLTRAHFDVSIPQSLLRALLPTGPDGNPSIALTPALPRFVVVVENPEQTGIVSETAIKRLPLTLNTADPSLPAAAIAPLLTAFGVTACTADEAAGPVFVGPADCLRAPVANQNPDVLGFVFGHEDDVPDDGFFTDDDTDGDGVIDVAPEVGLVSRIQATPGDTLNIDPVIARATFANHQAFRFDVATGKQVLENRVEDLAFEWFATSGDVGAATTSQQGGFIGPGNVRLGTTWTAPDTRRPGEHDALVIVMHDQRGGVAVATIDVEYP